MTHLAVFLTYYNKLVDPGRDGEISKCYTLYSPSDVQTLKYILRLSISSPIRLQKAYNKIEDVTNYCKDKTTCRSQLLLNYFGQSLNAPCMTCDNCQRGLLT